MGRTISVAVAVGVAVGVEVEVGDGVKVGEGVAVGLAVGVEVKVGVFVAVGGTGVWDARLITDRNTIEGVQALNGRINRTNSKNFWIGFNLPRFLLVGFF